jgi:hypothetical protein
MMCCIVGGFVIAQLLLVWRAGRSRLLLLAGREPPPRRAAAAWRLEAGRLEPGSRRDEGPERRLARSSRFPRPRRAVIVGLVLSSVAAADMALVGTAAAQQHREATVRDYLSRIGLCSAASADAAPLARGDG